MSNINFTDLQNSLPPSKIIQLVTALGSDEYVEKEDYIIFIIVRNNNFILAYTISNIIELHYFFRNTVV